jgi:hypothetical protein
MFLCLVKLLFHLLGKRLINQKPQTYPGHSLTCQDCQPVSFLCTRSVVESRGVIDSIVLDRNSVNSMEARTDMRNIAWLISAYVLRRMFDLP